MDNKMFCFQCEQTVGCTGCTRKTGVCGKTADVAKLQDELTSALIGLARATDGDTPVNADTWRLMITGLFTTVTNVNFNEKTIRELIDRVHAEKERLVPNCSSCGSRCGRNDDYDMNLLWNAQEDVRSLKSLILFGVRGMAAYAHHAMVLGYADEAVNRFFAKALFAIGEDWDMDELLPIVMEVGEKNLKCMALLDKANTESYGTPTPVTVPLTVEKGPFIVISGHDLHDLKLLLEQTEGKDVNIYTHGEMLPAHGYPELKKYSHLKGNFGTAWQNQQKEFAELPAPVLFTTNCLMPPKASYADRVFTTAVVSYPEMMHIGEDRDFTPVIEKALELGGYSEDKPFTGINGGNAVLTGFARSTVLGVADRVIEAVKHVEDALVLQSVVAEIEIAVAHLGRRPYLLVVPQLREAFVYGRTVGYLRKVIERHLVLGSNPCRRFGGIVVLQPPVGVGHHRAVVVIRDIDLRRLRIGFHLNLHLFLRGTVCHCEAQHRQRDIKRDSLHRLSF